MTGRQSFQNRQHTQHQQRADAGVAHDFRRNARDDPLANTRADRCRSAPLVAIAATAPIQTSSGDPKRAAMVAAVICPTSPHSEKKIAAKETIAALAKRRIAFCA